MNAKRKENLDFRSCDAFYSGKEEEWYLIEFKDGKMNGKLVKEIYEKIEDSKNILWDLQVLEYGYLNVDDMQSSLLALPYGEKNFGFATKMKELKYQNHLDYFRNHISFILVYNAKLVEETEYDKEGYRAGVKRGEYQTEIDFLNANPYLLKGLNAENFLNAEIEKGHFKKLCEMIKKASDIGNEEWQKLSKHFQDNIGDRVEILKRIENIKKQIGDENTVKAMTGDEFLTALYVFSVYNKRVLVELKKISQLEDLYSHKYDDLVRELTNMSFLVPEEYKDEIYRYLKYEILHNGFDDLYDTVMNNSDVYQKKFIKALAASSKIPERLFYLHRYEGKYFKEVLTYTQEQFEELFASKYEKIEKGM